MKFPDSTMLPFMEEEPRYNLAESTNRNLQFKTLMDEDFVTQLSQLKLGYGSCQGNKILRELIAQKLQTNANNILITNGAIGGIFLSMLCLCSKGDEILTFQPNFSATIDLIKGLGFEQKLVRLHFEEQYQLNVDKLLAQLTPKTKLIVLVSPINPSGTLLSSQSIQNLVQRLDEMGSDCKILIDETYREATYDMAPLPSFCNYSSRLITVSSLSKSHGTPGLRIGWLSTPNQCLLQQINLVKVNTLISNSVLDEFVAIKILQNEQDILQRNKEHLRQGLAVTKHWVEHNQEVLEWIEPQAGALCCIRLKKERFSQSSINHLYTLLNAANIQIGNGEWFGETPYFFRLGFAHMEINDLRQALNQLGKLLKSLAQYQTSQTQIEY